MYPVPVKAIIPELKRRAVGKDDAGQRRSVPHRRIISIVILFLSNVTASRK